MRVKGCVSQSVCVFVCLHVCVYVYVCMSMFMIVYYSDRFLSDCWTALRSWVA